MINLFKRRKNEALMSSDTAPKGIHHTISYAVSYNDTWNHIRNELRKMTLQTVN
jgi:hypothetical protein